MDLKLPAKGLAGLIALATLFFVPFGSTGQPPFKPLSNLFTEPKSYCVNYAKTPPVIDGDISDAIWQQAPWTDDFGDIEGDLKPKPPLRTRAKMLWDDS